MKRFITILIVLSFTGLAYGQNEESKPKDKPVWAPFESGYLIDNQTTVIPSAKTLEYIIQHKFGTMDNGFSDLFGLYAPGANIRMGLNYSLINNLQVGYGLTRLNMYSDFFLLNTPSLSKPDAIPFRWQWRYMLILVSMAEIKKCLETTTKALIVFFLFYPAYRWPQSERLAFVAVQHQFYTLQQN